MRGFIKKCVNDFKAADLTTKTFSIIMLLVFLYVILYLIIGFHNEIGLMSLFIIPSVLGIMLLFSMFPLFITFIFDMFFSKIMKNYNEKSLKKYDVPLLIYIAPLLPVLFLYQLSVDILSNNYYFGSNLLMSLDNNGGLSYFISVIMYLLIINIGMYKRLLRVGKDFYKQRLDHHKDFFKITLIPVTFAATVIGLIAGFNDFELKIPDIFTILNYLLFINSNDNFLVMSIRLSFILLIFSLPTLLLGYFFNQCFIYVLKYGTHYKQFFLRFFRKVITIFR
ncbi:hypothetical protein [Oceanobacillus sp. CFH 90083]|uniref:hypothetical protein n=1 Tax=Oceanobacillus sp. CFH 90083 TaxID=2592336 RepID=UPI00128D9E3E|nr:hypothetical protein [Oceanobacillus sp. CFH 90083]